MIRSRIDRCGSNSPIGFPDRSARFGNGTTGTTAFDALTAFYQASHEAARQLAGVRGGIEDRIAEAQSEIEAASVEIFEVDKLPDETQ